jgi:hypothetical protein
MYVEGLVHWCVVAHLFGSVSWIYSRKLELKEDIRMP